MARSHQSIVYAALLREAAASVQMLATDLGYLIKTEAFLPTGLTVGRTLATFDIIGVNGQTGQKILAQCKKDPVAVNVDPTFLQACEDVKTEAAVFYFAYSGCRGAPPWVRVVTRHEMSAWLSSGTGAEYLALWRGRRER